MVASRSSSAARPCRSCSRSIAVPASMGPSPTIALHSLEPIRSTPWQRAPERGATRGRCRDPPSRVRSPPRGRRAGDRARRPQSGAPGAPRGIARARGTLRHGCRTRRDRRALRACRCPCSGANRSTVRSAADAGLLISWARRGGELAQGHERLTFGDRRRRCRGPSGTRRVIMCLANGDHRSTIVRSAPTARRSSDRRDRSCRGPRTRRSPWSRSPGRQCPPAHWPGIVIRRHDTGSLPIRR